MSRPSGQASAGARSRGVSASRPSRHRAAGSPLLLSLLLSILPLSAPTLGAQSSEELRTGIARDVGDIAILEYDGPGSTYDARLEDGTLNVEARTRVGLRFYETHPDTYDFLVVFTNFAFETNDAGAFHLYGRNDVLGTGKPVGSIGPVVFGSPSRLKGWIDMAAVSQYREPPYSLEPGPGFLRTLGVLAHEVGHQWLAEARYQVGNTVFDDLLGADEAHWSYLLDSDASLHYGADWRDNHDGTFTAARIQERYSALDLYLMGMLPRDRVAPLTLLRNPAIDRHRINREGDVVSATGTSTITIDQIVDATGVRRPDHLHSQKEFRLGFVFLAAPGTEPSPEDLEAVDRIRRAFGAHFFALTNGVGWADTSLATPPAAPRATTLDLPRAVAWLGARQGLDGSWDDSPQTRPRDTAAAVVALLRARAALPAAQRGIAWLQAAQPESLDFQARVATALEPLPLATTERATRAARILGGQNPDGGFGAGRDFASDPLDTALALRALKALQHPEDARVRSGVAGLAALANADGGWAAIVGGETSTVVTAEVLLALQDWADAPGSAALRAPGLAALLSRRNPDGGFGSSPSTPYASALALEVLLRSGAGGELVDLLTAWLQQAQLADGSWASSPYQTALVIGALGQSLGPNLVVPADATAVSPNPAREGDVVRVVARVRNAGRVAAPATVARLHDGDPGSSAPLGEVPVPPLLPGEDAEVAFDFVTVDRAGSRTLYVVADASGQVRESREDDNTASRALTVEGRLADLQVLPADIALSPAVPELGETAVLSVTVRNRGERSSAACAIRASFTDPWGATVVLPLSGLPGLAPGQAASVTIPWSPAAEGAHVVRAAADVRYEVPESDETNGVAERTVRVLGYVPAGPDLSVAFASVAPASLEELPQAIEVRAVVENAGRTAASSTVAVVDGRSGERIGVASFDVGERTTRLVLVPATVSTPGARQLVVVVDPDGELAEANEGDNALSIGLPDARTLDVEVSAATLSAADVEAGARVTVTAQVRNRGTTDVLSIPVQLTLDAAGGPLELARTTLSLPAGQSRAVALSWTASVTGEAVPLAVRVDPFDLLLERREDNNAVPLPLRVRPSGLPNLAVSGKDVAIDPDPPVEGDAATLSAVVRNTGVVPAGPFTLRFVVGDPDAGGTVVAEASVDGVPAGAARTVSASWPRVEVRGSLGLYVVADSETAVEESDESDNRAFRPFSAVGLPDLVVTAADVVLDPGYPRAGEPVTIRATVRNLGGRSSATATSLAVAEGQEAGRVEVGSLPVPTLDPGAFVTLSLAWTPAAPPGARPLVLVLDPDDVVAEQDEGNNRVQRSVVVQDADLFLTEPVFSPDGDGVKDETTLAWRATGRVRVVVSNTRGEATRTLVEDGPESGSATWDGRDARGLVAWDGSYTVLLLEDGGRELGRAPVVLDTNRSPIHHAAPGRTTVRNLTCGLPTHIQGPAWTAGEDEVLYIVNQASLGFPVGLLRVGLNGGNTYVAQDPWYASASFVGAAAAPDGREVLVRGDGGHVHLVDLVAGERRPFPWVGDQVAWSPDGRFILSDSTVRARDGSTVTSLDPGAWVWSPASDRLARLVADEGSAESDRRAGPAVHRFGDPATELAQVVVVARDGASVGAVSLPSDEAEEAGHVYSRSLAWRGDGRIVADVTVCHYDGGEGSSCSEVSFLVDPDGLTAARLPFAAGRGNWSPDGGRVLLPSGALHLENGTLLGPLLPYGSIVSPRSSAAIYWKPVYDSSLPGSVCAGKGSDTFVVSSAANLAAQLDVARLPGNGGLVIRGTAADRNLERFQIDYASQAEPGTWRPIGAALDVPVLDDLLTIWVPPGPGTYVLRLSVSDRAGHAAVRTRVVSWDRVPLLANFTQSDYFLSPDGNGVKDAVLFRYTVLSPTRVDVRVVGPEPRGPGDPAAREVWRTAFEHTTFGPASFAWEGKDASDAVVPDGRYTVFINELPFRVEVDSTPPEIGLRFENLQVASGRVSVYEGCRPGERWRGGPEPFLPLSSVAAEQAWHVVDERLDRWVFRGATGSIYGESEPVFVPETDPSGAPVLDGGRPRVRRENGRPVDRRELQFVLAYVRATGLKLEAWDHAGNHTEVAVEPPAEAVLPLGAVWRENCEALAPALRVEASEDDTPAGGPVNGLRPEKIVLQVATSLRLAPEEQQLRLVVEPVKGGPSRELPLRAGAGHVNADIESFEGIGVDPTMTYRGRFRGLGEAGEVSSAPFVFSPCSQWLRAFTVISTRDRDPKRFVIVQVSLDAAVVEVRAGLTLEPIRGAATPLGTLDLLPLDEATARRLFEVRLDGDGEPVFFAQLPDVKIDCANRLRVTVRVKDAAGETYPSAKVESACQRLSFLLPGECRFGLALHQNFPGCAASPDVVYASAGGYADRPARVTIEGGPPESPVLIDTFDFVSTPEKPDFFRSYEVSVEGHSGETYPLRGRVVPHDPLFLPGAEASLTAIVDRAPPVATFLLPPEGGSVCLARDDAAPPLATLALADDAAPRVEPSASWRRDGGPWKPLRRLNCDAECQKDATVPTGRPFALDWDAAGFDAGWYELQMRVCDRSGNQGSTTRRVLVSRDAPLLQIISVRNPVFSPNGDGRVEDAQVTVHPAQAGSLSVRVHAGRPDGPLVRPLWTDVPQTATDVFVTWDGRAKGGQAVPDGEYWLVFSLADACGGATERSTRVEVDTVPPEVEIAEPSGGQRVSASVDVLGRATDAHLATWDLDLACGSSSSWTRLASRTHPVSAGSFLARWDTSHAPPGECRLRLAAEDRAGNRSPEAFATATVERGDLLENLSATPDIFSPNGDGRRETATLGYTLRRAARVFFEVKDSKGRVRAFETGEERAAGAWSHVWDGTKAPGEPAAEGPLVLWVRAEDPAVPTVYEEKTIRFELDRTPPRIAISRPIRDGWVSPAATVRGSVNDRNLARFTVSAAPAGSGAVELVRATLGSSAEGDLAPLSALAEGPHVLSVVASDTAENEASLDVPFLVDATPPRALIQSPARGAFLRKGEAPVAVVGLVRDDHLESWTLRFGAGVEPADFATIAQGQGGGDGIPLGAWDVRFVPDGVYTLSLVAVDRAGLTAESRVVVALDGLPPTTTLSSPTEGGYVRLPGPVVGAVADANLVGWDLEVAPGDKSTSYRWLALGSGLRSVDGASLAEWSPLPPDGVYTLRLTGRDEVGLTASTRSTVTVDTMPPAAPTGLAARVTRARDGYGLVEVTWNVNTEEDLAGYRIERPRAAWGESLLGSPAWDDGEWLEGRYTYRVLAEDKAGNQSPPATLQVLVDLTPPLVSFSFPAADAWVAGALDVRGTAHSADDFGEFRLFVGAGESPVAWTLLRRSSVPVAAGKLGEWLALVDGPHVLALEAEDTNGNDARVTRRVVVDTLPPEPPVLVAVAKEEAPADWLVPSWQPSPSEDVAGTLVYRNGRLANSTSIVVGDKAGFLVPGTSYEDRALPDGEHCYRVVAVDGAGNESIPSNEICRSLDNRAPHALVVHPPDGTRFGYPVRVAAETPDLDVASVRFERRVPGAPGWTAFGEVRSAPPWETTLDPRPAGAEELPAGAHELRAVATDRAGNTDLDPASITVTYGDTTAPPAPAGLVARVDGSEVALEWNPVDAADLTAYRVYRDGERIADGVVEPGHVDPGRDPGTYEYAVTAVDEEGNESAPSAPVAAVVYVLRLDSPNWPMVLAPLAPVSGAGSRLQTTVKVIREGSSVAEGPGTGGAFRIAAVPLAPEGNLLRARGEDAAGNRSILSNEIVVIENRPPGAVGGLEAEVDGKAVALSWAAVPDADVVGYVVRRDGERLTGAVPQEEASSIAATSRPWQAAQAFDGNPATAWVPEGGTGGAWTVTFPAPVLVERLHLRFARSEGADPVLPAAYTLLVRWQDRDLKVARVRGNTQVTAEHRLPSPFLTTAIRVELESPGGLAEVAIERLEVVAAGVLTFDDEGVADGRHAYTVAAIDRYGAEGEAGTVEAAVGDVDPPGAPTGLVATPVVRDVRLTWNPNPEPDVTGYVVLRDGARVGRSAAPAWVDPGRPNGTYRYAVIAVDAAGHESSESTPADATVDVQPVPPAVPVILEPTDAAHPLTLRRTSVDVAGHADPGSLVTLEVDGIARGTAPSEPGFRPAGVRFVYADGGDLALSPDGKRAVWIQYVDALSIQELGSSEVRFLRHGGSAGAWHPVFSPDGGTVLLSRRQSIAPYEYDLVLVRLAGGPVRVLASGRPVDYAWSADGSRLAVSFYESQGSSLHVVDVATGESVELGRSAGIDAYPRWSPDGTRLALVRSWGTVTELRVLDLSSSRDRVLDSEAENGALSWSPDGIRLAWTARSDEVRLVRVEDLATGQREEIAETGSDAMDPRFSPQGDWLSFIRIQRLPEGWTMGSLRAAHRQGLRVTVTQLQSGYWSPEAHDWLAGQLAVREQDRLSLFSPEAGRFVVREVPLAPGENRLVARALDPATDLESADSETVVVTVPGDAFPDLAAFPEGIGSLPPVPVTGQAAQLRVQVENVGDNDASEAEVRVRVIDPAGGVVLDTRATLPLVPAGDGASLLLPWTPAAPAPYTVRVEVDPDGRVAESSEANNAAERTVRVLAEEGLGAEVTSDRSSYPAASTARVTVSTVNAGTPFVGVARTTVEDAAGGEVARLDEREVSLEWGRAVSWDMDWAVGATRAGRYRFVVRLCPTGETEAAAVAERLFDVEPGLALLARVRPEPATAGEGAAVSFAQLAQNQGANAPLAGATARLRVQLEGAVGPARFETVRALPTILPGGTWEAADLWPTAGPAGRYAVLFEIERGGSALASAAALVTVVPAAAQIQGTLSVSPGDVLAGQPAEARVTVENRGAAGVSGHPILVDVVSGAEATVHFSVPATVDLGPGQSRSLVLAIGTAAVPPGRHVVRLRAGPSPVTLDRSSLVVHGLVAPPSPHAPANGARVPTAHPALVVNNASSPEGAALAYEFQLFGDEPLTQPVAGATGVAETPSRTAWPLLARLAEDTEYWWRARATDGFSTSAWSAVSTFTVDAVNRPPTAPVPDTPVPGARVASRQPRLTVRNAVDPERQPMTYEFRLAADEGVTQVVAAQSGLAQGPGFTAWDPGATLDEDAVYYWTARARTSGNEPEDFSPWSEPVSFRVDAVNEPPTAPRPLRPIDGRPVATRSPDLVIENATDPEGEPLAYRFEIDTRPTLDSPARQVSPELQGGLTETSWTPTVALDENTVYYWRAHASDGFAETPSPLASFFVNVANEAPGAPVPLDPVDGRTVGTDTPALLLRNAADPDGDALTYEIAVRDAAGAVVAAATGIASGVEATAWTVTTALAENQAFTWSARASDAEIQGPWSAPAAFRVDAVVEPPTAPIPLLPADGAVVEERRPALVVVNATSPDSLALAYAFELEAVAADGSTSPVARVEGVAETEDTTAWTPPPDLADGSYQWRARASDARASGPWSATSRFAVLVDPPPAAPLGLRALAGDGRVRLDWSASPEPDVNGYRVYRSTTAGGPHDFVAPVTTPGLDDLGLTNGLTYFYVVTATDARAESARSNEAAARPEAPATLVAEVRYDPAVIRGECLLPGRPGHRDARDRRLWSGAQAGGGAPEALDGPACRRENACPEWLYATLELPAGYDPATIDAPSLRLFGSVPADPGYRSTVDVDRDGLAERRVRFAFDRVAPHLSVGVEPATIVGRAAGVEVRGTGSIEVLPLGAGLRVTPRTLQRRSCGEDLLATLTFAEGLSASAVDVASVRLNGVVPVERVVRACGRELSLKFDRGAAIAVLPVGSSVEVRVTGTLRGVPFVGLDHIRVIQ